MKTKLLEFVNIKDSEIQKVSFGNVLLFDRPAKFKSDIVSHDQLGLIN